MLDISIDYVREKRDANVFVKAEVVLTEGNSLLPNYICQRFGHYIKKTSSVPRRAQSCKRSEPRSLIMCLHSGQIFSHYFEHREEYFEVRLGSDAGRNLV